MKYVLKFTPKTGPLAGRRLLCFPDPRGITYGEDLHRRFGGFFRTHADAIKDAGRTATPK